MTENDLHRMRRRDLLELLLEQAKENADMQEKVQRAETTRAEVELNNEKLKLKLDEKDMQLENLKEKLNDKDAQIENFKEKLTDKDEQIEHLKSRLDEKDKKIAEMTEDRRIVKEEIGSIAEASLLLNKVFAAAQAAADQYLYNVKQACGRADEEDTGK